MKILFVDNFRGFSKTYIPIKDVNFLVGENSTGKTSILGVLKLLTSHRFWFNSDFNTEEVNFGHFNDIVSISAKDRSYFSIGFIESAKDNKNGSEHIHAHLLTFNEQDGVARPALYAQYSNGNEIRVRIKSKKTEYKLNTSKPYDNVKEFVQHVFNDWVSAYQDDKTGYKVYPKELKGLNIQEYPLPLIFIASEIVRLEKREKTHRSLRNYLPLISEDIAWLAPIRTKPRRTYDDYRVEFSSEGIHTPYLIKKILDKGTKATDFVKFLKKVGSDTGLFETIRVKRYGRSATSPFELDVIINSKALSVSNVGYGVSQSLPVIVEVFARPKESWFAIQQPEVHLHPKAQAALGDIFFELAVKEKKRFLVETHSDYTIDRYRMNYTMNNKEHKPDAQILYFERVPEGNEVFQLEIQPNGELPNEQPKGYRDFFIKEEVRLLGI